MYLPSTHSLTPKRFKVLLSLNNASPKRNVFIFRRHEVSFFHRSFLNVRPRKFPPLTQYRTAPPPLLPSLCSTAPLLNVFRYSTTLSPLGFFLTVHFFERLPFFFFSLPTIFLNLYFLYTVMEGLYHFHQMSFFFFYCVFRHLTFFSLLLVAHECLLLPTKVFPRQS